MPGPQPKDPAVRARRNKPASSAVLPAAPAVRGPDLPAGHEWHQRVQDWWAALREHPVATRYTALDWQQALDVAELRQLYATAPTGRLFALIQQASVGLGLSEADRRRNGWGMQVTPQVPAEAPPLPAAPRRPVPRRMDPRRVLRTVQGGKARSA